MSLHLDEDEDEGDRAPPPTDEDEPAIREYGFMTFDPLAFSAPSSSPESIPECQEYTNEKRVRIRQKRLDIIVRCGALERELPDALQEKNRRFEPFAIKEEDTYNRARWFYDISDFSDSHGGADDMVKLLNKYAFYQVHPQPGVVLVTWDHSTPKGRHRFHFLPAGTDFKALFINAYCIKKWGKKDRLTHAGFSKSMTKPTEQEHVISWWLKQAKMRTVGEHVFQPSYLPGFGNAGPKEEVQNYSRTFNTWDGYKYYIPDKIEDYPHDFNPENAIQLFIYHMRVVISNERLPVFHFLLSWMSTCLCQPERLVEVMVLNYGGEGTGKSQFWMAFINLFAENGIVIQRSASMNSQFFGSTVRNKVVVYFDELDLSKIIFEWLKSFLTSSTMHSEKKGVDAVQVPNFAKCVATSNTRGSLPSGSLEMRRFFIIDSSSKHVGHTRYFEMFANFFTNAKSEHFPWGLRFLHRFLVLIFESGDFVYDQSKKPKTPEAVEQRIHSLSPVHAFWATCLRNGEHPGKLLRGGLMQNHLVCPFNKQRPLYEKDWATVATLKELYDGFVAQSDRKTTIHLLTFEAELKKVLPDDTINTRATAQENFEMPTLERCQTHFNSVTFTTPEPTTDPKKRQRPSPDPNCNN